MIQNLFMVMRYTHTINKFFLLMLVLTFGVILTSCRREIPKGDIRDFVEQFDYDKAYENTPFATSVITSAHYVSGVLQGKVTTRTYIDLRDGKYYYAKTTLSGDYYGLGEDQFEFFEKETIGYLDESGNAVAYELTDGILETMEYRVEDIDLLINSFFYNNVNSGYHTGGVYYGDHILANCAKNYPLFSLNEEKTQLKYAINTIYEGMKNQKVIIMHTFTVNQLGMIISLSTQSLDEDNQDTYSITTIECDYTTPMDKIMNFEN